MPVNVNLELDKYLNKRGKKPLDFRPEQEFKDPCGIQDKLTSPASLGIGGKPATAPPPAPPPGGAKK